MKTNLKLLLIAGVALAGLSGCATSEKTIHFDYSNISTSKDLLTCHIAIDFIDP